MPTAAKSKSKSSKAAPRSLAMSNLDAPKSKEHRATPPGSEYPNY